MNTPAGRAMAGLAPRPQGHATYLVAYDIRDPARLRRVHARTAADGLRLHCSLYTADLTVRAHARLRADLAVLIDRAVDDVRHYPVPELPRGAWSGPLPLADDLMLLGSPAASLAGRLARQRV